MDTVTAAPNRGIARWGGLGAILYVVLFIGHYVLFTGAPDSGSAPAKIVA